MCHGLYDDVHHCFSHDPWGFVTITVPMTHGKKSLKGLGVTNNIVIRRPAGERDVWPSQEFDCRFNERRDTKYTGNTKDHSRMDHAPKELTPEVIQHIPIQIEDGPLP